MILSVGAPRAPPPCCVCSLAWGDHQQVPHVPHPPPTLFVVRHVGTQRTCTSGLVVEEGSNNIMIVTVDRYSLSIFVKLSGGNVHSADNSKVAARTQRRKLGPTDADSDFYSYIEATAGIS
jgi:hypothetical protein